MKFSYSLLLSIAVTLVTADDGYVRVPIQRKQLVPTNTSSNAVVSNNAGSAEGDPITQLTSDYVAQIGVGTPPQKIDVLLDTGSSDLWVTANDIEGSGTYKPKDSSTYHFINSNFAAGYGSGQATGDWVTDEVSLGDFKTGSQRLGYAYQSTDGLVAPGDGGILGLGYKQSEAPVINGGTAADEYDNFLASLAKQGSIKKRAFSVSVDSEGNHHGEIVIGGLDTKKYTGQLYTVPIDSDGDLSATVKVGDHIQHQVVLDTGTSTLDIPSDVFHDYGKRAGAKYDGTTYYYDGQPPSSGPDLQVSVGGATITIPFEQIVAPFNQVGGDKWHPYVLALSARDQDGGIFGDPFFRSAYVVFDLDGRTISVAQAAPSTSDSNIEVISDGIPGAKPAPGF